MDSFPISNDGIYEDERQRAFSTWTKLFLPQTRKELEKFVTDRVGGRGPAKFVSRGLHDGSFNRVMRFSFTADSGEVALKFPAPGRTDKGLSQEKIINEAEWMQFFKENTAIPVPAIYSCTTRTNGDLLLPLGGLPYILMDWVPGTDLRLLLREDIPAELRRRIFRQMASIYLKLYRLTFDAIGSVARDPVTGKWGITQRPLTMDMHQFAIGIPEFPRNHWPVAPLKSSAAYFEFVLQQHAVQLWHLRNLNLDTSEESSAVSNSDDQVGLKANRRFKARIGFGQLVDHFCNDEDTSGPFRPYCPDLDPRNVRIDRDTGVITGLFDVEFTNAMPAQFSRDPPLWLYQVLPREALNRGFFLWFESKYEPLLFEFIDAMKSIEGDAETQAGKEKLSSCMLRSWKSRRVWFDFAATFSDQVDSVYWVELFKHHPGKAAPDLSRDQEAELEKYQQHTKGQVRKYLDDAQT